MDGTLAALAVRPDPLFDNPPLKLLLKYRYPPKAEDSIAVIPKIENRNLDK